jgi:hypothetical protein
MALTGKIVFNIDNLTIHSTLNIPIQQYLSNLPNLSSYSVNWLTCQYEQFQLVVIDEISIVGAKMFNIIDDKQRSIKHIQKKFFGGVDVIMINYFDQALPMKDNWIFQNIKDNVNSFNTKFLANICIML